MLLTTKFAVHELVEFSRREKDVFVGFQSYPKILIISYLSYQFRGLLENSVGQVNQLRNIPSFYDVIGESVRKTTCNRYSLQLIVNIGGKHVNYL